MGERQISARRIGYVAQEVPVVVREESAVATNITMTPMVATQLSQTLVTGVATKTAPANLGAAITVLKKDTSATTRREVYEVSPGIRVTLVDSLTNIVAKKDLKTRTEARATPSAPAAAPMAATSTPAPAINTIVWTDGNHHYTLSGPLAPKELEALKPRIMRMRR